MRTAKSVGRIVGILLFAQLVGLMVGFILLVPITSSAFLENTAAISSQIRTAIFFLLATSALTIGISIYAYPVFREHSSRMALWLVALSVLWFAMQAVDNQHILSMISLSQQYAGGVSSNADIFGILATAVRSERRWAHYTELLVMDLWFFMLYLIMFSFALVPRVVSGFALAMVVVHAAAIPLPALIGYPSLLMLAYSMLLSYLVIGTWLVAKGFYGSANSSSGSLPA